MLLFDLSLPRCCPSLSASVEGSGGTGDDKQLADVGKESLMDD